MMGVPVRPRTRVTLTSLTGTLALSILCEVGRCDEVVSESRKGGDREGSGVAVGCSSVLALLRDVEREFRKCGRAILGAL